MAKGVTGRGSGRVHRNYDHKGVEHAPVARQAGGWLGHRGIIIGFIDGLAISFLGCYEE